MVDFTNKKIIYEYPVKEFDFYSIFNSFLQKTLLENDDRFKIDKLHNFFFNIPKDIITVDNDQNQHIYKLL